MRIVTVTQTAKVASIIMLKTTHEGREKSLRRAFARVADGSGESLCGGGGKREGTRDRALRVET